MNPFDLAGPDFLALFACLCVAAFAVGYVVRRITRGAASPPGQPPDLSPAEIGYLSGGPALAVNVALTRLVEGGAVTFDETAKTLEKRGDGKMAMSRVTLRPRVSWGGNPPDEAAIADLHHRAHEACFIANSVTSEIIVSPAE